jgi:hypothetical protein
VTRSLHDKPTVSGVEIEHIDFSPELGCMLVRHHNYDREEELQPPEVEAVRRWLHCFAQSVKRELGM